MGKEAIELAKSQYRPEKADYPATVSVKLDGVPTRLSKQKLPQSRQNEDFTSLAHIQNFFMLHLSKHDIEVVGEVYVHGMPFKDISGRVRDTKQQFPEAKLYAFDMIVPDKPDAPWGARMEALKIVLADVAGLLGKELSDLPIVAIQGITVNNPEEAVAAHESFMQALPGAEGTILASHSKTWEQGKRKWTYQKNKPEPTIDLEIIGFQEAQSAEGVPLGRVGRLIAKLWRVDAQGVPQPRQIGIGPGKMTHTEAKKLWQDYLDRKWLRRIAEVKYMPDASYDALRQPTFQCWRDDKDDPDIVGEM